MKKIILKAHQNEISKGIEFIRDSLSKMKVEKKEIVSILLTAEEVLAKLIENCPSEKETVKVYVKSLLGNITVHMSCKGERFEISELKSVFEYTDEDDAEMEAVIRNLMNKVLGDNITISSRRNVNMADIKVKATKYQQLIYTISALLLGILTGLIMKFFVPNFITAAVSQNLFACISILLPQIGIPAEAISLIMGIYTLVGMGLTCTNVTGDAAVTTIVARTEGMIDLDKYNSN